MHTEEQAKQWVTKNRQELINSLIACAEVPEIMKGPGNRFEEVWCAGCWLNEKLRKAGATKEITENIGFAHGQRSLFGDTYQWAVTYLNEFISRGEVADKPGIELADQINDEVFQNA